MRVTKLNINNNALKIEEKYPFLAGEPYSLSLESGGFFQITINYITQSLQYSLFDSVGNNTIYRASLQEYPFNLTNETERALFFINGYIVDCKSSDDLAKVLQNELDYSELLALIQNANTYTGEA